MTSSTLLAATAIATSCLYAACGCDCPSPPYSYYDAPDIPVAEVAPLPPDVDEPDVADIPPPPDRGAKICLGLIELCVAECANGPCFDACLNARAFDLEEESLTHAYVRCVVDAQCVPPTSPTADAQRASYACELQSCLSERVECEQRRGGGGECAPIGGCLADCEPQDFNCYRSCMRKATVPAAMKFVQLQYCVSANCAVPGGTREDFDACLGVVIGVDGVCKPEHSACYGPLPGPQSRGLQPLYGTLPRDPWP